MIETERQPGLFEPGRAFERRAGSASRPPASREEVELSAQRSLFANNARFLSMLAIVALHSVTVGPSAAGSSATPLAMEFAENLCKFGSIGFFLVSGFLLGPMFETGSRSGFLTRRLNKILLPWLAWFTLATALSLLGAFLRHRLSLGLNLNSLIAIGSAALGTLTGTSYWFVPNLFLSTCVLLLLRKHLRSLWLGGCLFAFTLFYGVNIYAKWLPTSHKTALGGYIFFLWLGDQWSRHYQWLSGQLKRVSLLKLSLIISVLFELSIFESDLIRNHTNSDPGNTLRISNQLYSIAVVLLIMKLRSATWPRFVDVRGDLFGVYLTHWIILFKVVAVATFISDVAPALSSSHGQVESILWRGLLTLVVFGLSVGLTKLLRRHNRAAWLVGDLSRQRAPRRELAAPEHTGNMVVENMGAQCPPSGLVSAPSTLIPKLRLSS